MPASDPCFARLPRWPQCLTRTRSLPRHAPESPAWSRSSAAVDADRGSRRRGIEISSCPHSPPCPVPARGCDPRPGGRKCRARSRCTPIHRHDRRRRSAHRWGIPCRRGGGRARRIRRRRETRRDPALDRPDPRRAAHPAAMTSASRRADSRSRPSGSRTDALPGSSRKESSDGVPPLRRSMPLLGGAR